MNIAFDRFCFSMVKESSSRMQGGHITWAYTGSFSNAQQATWIYWTGSDAELPNTTFYPEHLMSNHLFQMVPGWALNNAKTRAQLRPWMQSVIVSLLTFLKTVVLHCVACWLGRRGSLGPALWDCAAFAPGSGSGCCPWTSQVSRCLRRGVPHQSWRFGSRLESRRSPSPWLVAPLSP